MKMKKKRSRLMLHCLYYAVISHSANGRIMEDGGVADNVKLYKKKSVEDKETSFRMGEIENEKGRGLMGIKFEK